MTNRIRERFSIWEEFFDVNNLYGGRDIKVRCNNILFMNAICTCFRNPKNFKRIKRDLSSIDARHIFFDT